MINNGHYHVHVSYSKGLGASELVKWCNSQRRAKQLTHRGIKCHQEPTVTRSATLYYIQSYSLNTYMYIHVHPICPHVTCIMYKHTVMYGTLKLISTHMHVAIICIVKWVLQLKGTFQLFDVAYGMYIHKRLGSKSTDERQLLEVHWYLEASIPHCHGAHNFFLPPQLLSATHTAHCYHIPVYMYEHIWSYSHMYMCHT